MARGVDSPEAMPLPFDLPRLSRAFSDLTPASRVLGREAGEAAARALSEVVGREVRIRGAALPGAPSPLAHAARRTVELSALPTFAAVEVEPTLVARVVDLLAGGLGTVDGAASLTPVESAALDLLLATALDAACSAPAVETALGPRLSAGPGEPPAPLAVDLEVRVGEVRGRARLLLPAAAVRALRGEPSAEPAAGALRLPGSLLGGSAPLSAEELDALEPGDVVLVDVPPDGVEVLALPGGLRASGRFTDGLFHVEEMNMTDRHGGLPVTLEVELARVEISLAELGRLEPGMAIPLGVDRRGLVALRAGDRTIARGELVELDGAVGVRILSLEGTP